MIALLYTCRARLDHLHRTGAYTLPAVPDPALVPAQGVLLLHMALTRAGVTVKTVPGIVTDLLLLQTVTLTGNVLLYSDGGT